MPTAVAAARQSYADHPMVRLETAPPGPCHAVSLQETLSGTFTVCATVILEWLSRFLRLLNGIPSHDTFGRVFSRLDPDQFGACFMNWVQSVAELTPGEVVAIDGKTLRRCHDRGQGRAPLHLVSA